MFWKKLFSDQEWRKEKWAVIALFIGILFTCGFHFFTQKSLSDSAALGDEITRDYELAAKLQLMENHLLAMERNMQNYIRSQDRDYFLDIDRNMVAAQRQFDEIERLIGLKDIPLTDEFFTLKKIVEDKIQFHNNLLDSFRLNGRENAEHYLTYGGGDRISEQFDRAIKSFQRVGDAKIQRDIASGKTQNNRTLLWDNLAFLVGILLLSFAVLYLLYSLSKRMRLEQSLRQANEAIERSAHIKEQFLANMSHEIRTPLQAILGYTNLLAKEPIPERAAQLAAGIQTAGENLLAIVNDILDVSKIESGMMRLESVPFSISGLMHSVQNMFQSKVAEKGIYLKLHPNPAIPDTLIGDPTRLTQILVNLISNAIKFTSEGGIDIFQEAESQTPNRLVLKIAVKDTGIGIPPEKQAQIFERFEQADAEVTRMYGGSGLGLFIVKQLAEMQGGSVQVESQPGKGSTFIVRIPYQIADEKNRPDLGAKDLVNLRNNFGDIKILLVEDNLMNQRVVGLFLDQWGIDYDVAENGKVAIELLENNHYDLVLMDVQMPEMDGYSATEYIRENLRLSIPIIAMTAHAFAGEREKALSFGMNEYISKPVKEDDLYKIIARFVPLSPTQSRRPTASANHTPPAGDDGILIDYNFLMQSSKGKKDYLRGILELFLQQAPAQLAEITRAQQQKDWDTLKKTAHSLKSTVGYAGLRNSLTPIIERLETAAAQPQPDAQKIETLVHNLKQSLDQACHKVKTEAMHLVAS